MKGWARSAAGLLLLSGALTPGLAQASPIAFSASGANAASIQPTVDVFRTALGSPNNGDAPGPLAGGRREINWDGGGTLLATVSPTPFTGFQDIRGATFTTPGTGFIQAPPDGLAAQFGNATYSVTFAPFSPARLFTPIGSNVTDVTFSVPGTGGVPALVSGFGAVFSDVDSTGTTIALFGPGDALLGSFPVPPTPGSGTFSFLGILFDAGEQIEHVRITTGNAALGPNDVLGEIDVVVMDDFLFSEPVAVPEPGPLALLASGLAAFATARRVRSRTG